MEYSLKFSFKDKPVCSRCQVSAYHQQILGFESKLFCHALLGRPRCPEKGNRKDCPLTDITEVVPQSVIEMVSKEMLKKLENNFKETVLKGNGSLN